MYSITYFLFELITPTAKNEQNCTSGSTMDCGVGFLGSNCVCVCPNAVSGSSCEIGEEIQTGVFLNIHLFSP